MSDSQDCSLNHNEELALSTYEHDLETMINSNLSHGQDLYTQQLFNVFQNAATAVTKMFRERSSGTNNWNTFHAAAESVTMLYKESLDVLKESIQLGIINGEQRQTKKLVCWARRKQRRYIPTRELYDYLIDRPSHASASSSSSYSAGSHSAEDINSPIPAVDDLQTFRQALMMNEHSSLDQDSNSCSSHSETSQQLESFVRGQVADQLARKRHYLSTDSSTNTSASEFPKLKRSRHT